MDTDWKRMNAEGGGGVRPIRAHHTPASLHYRYDREPARPSFRSVRSDSGDRIGDACEWRYDGGDLARNRGALSVVMPYLRGVCALTALAPSATVNRTGIVTRH